LGVLSELGGKLHLKLNIVEKTDSEKVVWTKDEKNLEKGVKFSAWNC
jgi:hypothetical protein